jgi:ribonuclease HII
VNKTKPNYKIENELKGLGFNFVAGLDEAGRGALAGPLVVACVILSTDRKIYNLNDSKLIASSKRKLLSEKIKSQALDWAVGISTVPEIDRFGIQSCSYMAFERAINSLKNSPDFLLVDHYRIPSQKIPQRPITKGDRISVSISAASIIAKVHRDELMIHLSSEDSFARFGFDRNFGYGTRKHLETIQDTGPSPLHRKNFIAIDNNHQTVLNFYRTNKKEKNEKSYQPSQASI